MALSLAENRSSEAGPSNGPMVSNLLARLCQAPFFFFFSLHSLALVRDRRVFM